MSVLCWQDIRRSESVDYIEGDTLIRRVSRYINDEGKASPFHSLRVTNFRWIAILAISSLSGPNVKLCPLHGVIYLSWHASA